MICETWHVTPDTSHKTQDMCHVQNDIWYVSRDTQWVVNIVSTFQVPSSNGLGVRIFWTFWGKGLVSFSFNWLQRCLQNSSSYTGSVKYLFQYIIIMNIILINMYRTDDNSKNSGKVISNTCSNKKIACIWENMSLINNTKYQHYSHDWYFNIIQDHRLVPVLQPKQGASFCYFVFWQIVKCYVWFFLTF